MRIIGTGSVLPSKVVTNNDLSKFLDTSDEWIVPRTGIRTRHVITDEKLEDMAIEAARKAIDESGLKLEEIDYFICSNVVNEYVTPGLSCIIAAGLGLTCPCVDINCACPGFVYALDMAEAYYKAGKVKNVLIACIEEPTRMVSWEDRSTCVLFGDGAGAVVLTEGDNIKGTKLHSEPDIDKIWMTRALTDSPYVTVKEPDVALQMKGREVFRFAVNACTNGVKDLLDEVGIKWRDADIYVNPTGRFVVGGPMGDTGLTGRKIIVDTYGGMGRHGGGCFSGKDCTKVDRSAAYAARWVAKNVVAAGLAHKCEVELAYAIGVSHPLSIMVDTFGTGAYDDELIEKAVEKVFDLRPGAIIRDLDLRRPIFQKTAAYGHFGRKDPDFTWEATNRVDELKAAIAEVAE